MCRLDRSISFQSPSHRGTFSNDNWTTGAAGTDNSFQSPSHRGTFSGDSVLCVAWTDQFRFNPLLIGALSPTITGLRARREQTTRFNPLLIGALSPETVYYVSPGQINFVSIPFSSGHFLQR